MTDVQERPPGAAAAPAVTSASARAERGRAVRRRVRRSTLGDWEPAASRDPLAILDAQERTRVPELLPHRHERMAESPFAFFRGAAAVMAADLAPCPRTDLEVQLCGDAHLVNFGAFASPERSLVFDLNDFDETLPGPFEWDVKRLAASFEVAGRANGLPARVLEEVQLGLGATYAAELARFAAMPYLDVWYDRLTIDEVAARWGDEAGPEVVSRLRRNIDKAKRKDRLKALRRLTHIDGGEVRFLSDPPLLQPAVELMPAGDHGHLVAQVQAAYAGYRRTLSDDRQVLLDRYRMVDLARKVVGVGSVGTRCWVALLMGQDEDDPLFLQVKEAERSVLEAHLRPSPYRHQGRRVVEGQRLVQAVSDILLGWDQVTGVDGRTHDYYFRQLWDWKASADVESMEPSTMVIYARICASVLARAHARSGDSTAISAYLGRGDALGRAMVRFASAYADQNQADHAAFRARWEAERAASA